MRAPHQENPFNALPPVVVVLALFLFGVELALQAAEAGFIGGAQGLGWRIALMEQFAVVPELFRVLWEMGIWPADQLVRLVAYPMVHANFMHMLFAVVFILALGKMVAEVFAAWAVLVVFFGSSIFGALVYLLIVPVNSPLIGAYPGAYGLIGAYTFILWVYLRAVGQQQAQAFTLIGFLMGIQLLFSLFPGSPPDWIADLSGFAAGFGLSVLVSPGGFQRLMAKFRQR